MGCFGRSALGRQTGLYSFLYSCCKSGRVTAAQCYEANEHCNRVSRTGEREDLEVGRSPHLAEHAKWRLLRAAHGERSPDVPLAKTRNRKHAVEELFKRRTAVGAGEDPYAEPKAVTVGEVIHRYQADGYLDRDLQPRPRSRSPTRNAIATPCSNTRRPLLLKS